MTAFLRCQLHCHTTASDGCPEPAALLDRYADAGFDVMAITDHWAITAPPSDRVLVLPAAELSAHLERPPFEVEVLAIGIDVLPEPREAFPTLAACVAWVLAAGGAPFLAHPRWSALVPGDALAAPGLAGLEVFNGGCEIEQGNGVADAFWDAVSDQGLLLPGIATDDAHDACGEDGSDSLLGWVNLRAAERTRDAVLAALKAGAFHASTGPTLLAVDAGAEGVEVACTPAASVGLVSGPWDGCRVNADPARTDYRGTVLERDANGLIIRARMELPEFCAWGRVEVRDPNGGRAWGAPIELPGPRRSYR